MSIGSISNPLGQGSFDSSDMQLKRQSDLQGVMEDLSKVSAPPTSSKKEDRVDISEEGREKSNAMQEGSVTRENNRVAPEQEATVQKTQKAEPRQQSLDNGND